METNQRISDSELELMRIIWDNNGSAFFAEIMKVLEENKKTWNINTVLTFLSRLVDKKMLKTQKINRKNKYIAIVSENDYANLQTRNFLDKIYQGNAKNLVSTLIKQDYLSNEDFEELKRFWNEGKSMK